MPEMTHTLLPRHRKISVAIVDDSPSMRNMIRAAIRQSDDIIVVGEAGDPYEARALIKATNPDVITLDVEMPRMSGIDFLQKIMSLRPMPVVMVSSLTREGSAASIEALALGAVDCVAKPTSQYPHSLSVLPEILRAAAGANLQASRGRQPITTVHSDDRYDGIIAIGASTGGVEALLTVLSTFPKKCPPTVIVQHMPAAFTKSFAARLNANSNVSVVEAEDGMVLSHGSAYVAPGSDFHMEVVGRHTPRCRLVAGENVSGHRPSVDVLFDSLCSYAPNVVGALLTGMGRDGAEGLKSLRASGCQTLVQDEATSVVFGMPKAALAIDAAEDAFPIEQITGAVLERARMNGIPS
ncbi:MAG: chemotaxis response regulator protein-glutamate methylesterase [Pseudomonadota bacterium]